MSTRELAEFELQRHAAVPASGDELGRVGVELLLPAIARDLDDRPNDRPALRSTVSRQSSTCQIAARIARSPRAGTRAIVPLRNAHRRAVSPAKCLRFDRQVGSAQSLVPGGVGAARHDGTHDHGGDTRSDLVRRLGHPPITTSGSSAVRPHSTRAVRSFRGAWTSPLRRWNSALQGGDLLCPCRRRPRPLPCVVRVGPPRRLRIALGVGAAPRVRERWDGDSDIDLLVVLDSFDTRDAIDLEVRAFDIATTSAPFDVSFTDPKRYLERSRVAGTIERATVLDGRCLYQRD